LALVVMVVVVVAVMTTTNYCSDYDNGYLCHCQHHCYCYHHHPVLWLAPLLVVD
jgi:hypothetical protein